MNQRDPYEVLGIGTDATGADIARAYRRLARAVHPDSRPGDPAATIEFQVVSNAYELLSDPARRASYDYRHRTRPTWRRTSPGTPTAAGPALWPVSPVNVPGEPAGPVHGTTLWAGPVRIEPAEPAGPPGPRDSSGLEPLSGPAVLAWLAHWLLADPREQPW